MLLYIMVLLNVVLLVAGQVLFKMGLKSIGALTVGNMFSVFLSPLIWVGLILYVVATLLWFAVLSREQLSAVYPLQSLSYILGLIVSIWILHENVPPLRWAGTFVILLGVILVSWQVKA